jgi:hypothetical protein
MMGLTSKSEQLSGWEGGLAPADSLSLNSQVIKILNTDAIHRQ